MTWSDEPTDSQIGALYRWLSWNMAQDKARQAVNFLRDNSTRREVSIEMSRVKELYDHHLLNEQNAFESDIWEDYKRLMEKEDE